MPEGHTIHRLAREHKQLFGGQRLRVSSPQGRFAESAAVLDGRALEVVTVVSPEASGESVLVCAEWPRS